MINYGADRELDTSSTCHNKCDGNLHTSAMLAQIHVRQVWIDAMLTPHRLPSRRVTEQPAF